MKQTIVRLVDDLTGGDADETVSFSYQGTAYTIDLSEKNAAKLREQLRRHIDAARRIPRQRQGSGPLGDAKKHRADVRAWARKNGWPDISDRGSIRPDIVEQYIAARHGHRR